MITKYRLVQFVPDPFLDDRVTIGAVWVEGGRARFVQNRRLPDARCLGGVRHRVTMDTILNRLERASNFTRLEMALGPHAFIDEERVVPLGASPPAWLEQLLGVGRGTSEAEQEVRRATRGTLGYQFLSTWDVARFVRKTFNPKTDLSGRFAAAAPLGQITHWVWGLRSVLLMEPVVVGGARERKTAADVAKTFAAYRRVAERAGGASTDLRFMAYVLPGGPSHARAEALGLLAPFADASVDLDDVSARRELVQEIKAVGSSGELPAVN